MSNMEETVKNMIQKELGNSLGQEPIDVDGNVKGKQETEKDVEKHSFDLDNEDKLRLENIVLKQKMEEQAQEIEQMRAELSRRNLNLAKNHLQALLYEKHQYDSEKWTVSIEAQQQKVTFSPKDKE